MHHRGTLRYVMLVAAGFWAAVAMAQTSKPSSGEGTAGPEFVPVRTDKASAKPGTAKPESTPAERTGGDANAGGARGGGTLRTDQQSPWGSMWPYAVLLGGFVLLYMWMGRSRRKQEAKRREMLAGLKKNDKVVTIGGIIGTVIEARSDEVTVKVDETNNVRMRFARWAIRGVGEDAKETPDDVKK